MKRFSALMALLLLLGALAAPAADAGKKKKKKTPAKVVVGEDPAGDWGSNSALGTDGAPIGDALGQDMISATIEKDGDNLNFIIGLNSLPPTGGVPEFTRYTWDFVVDGEALEIDGKFTNYTRGACDPTSGQCPPPRDPGQQPFLVRGHCTTEDLVATTFTFCEELAVVQGIFDAASATITVPVPMENIEAKPGSKIAGGTNTFAGSISAAPSAWATYGSFPMDNLVITKTYVVPK